MNRGAQALREALAGHGDKAKLAKSLAIDPGAVTRWCSGELTPGLHHRRSLEDRFQISWRLWDEGKSGKVRKPKRRRVAKKVAA
jgi:ribosome-binding protein aMBF1 (putative translation factor)